MQMIEILGKGIVATTTEQIYNLENCQIMNTKFVSLSFMSCAQSSDAKVMF